MIHVGIDPEQPLEYRFGDGEEIIREGDADFAWKETLVIQLVLHHKNCINY